MTATRTPGGDPRLVRRYLAAQGRRPFLARLSDTEDDADEGEGQDPRELAELMAEVLYGVFGDGALEALGGDEDDEDDDSGEGDVQLSHDVSDEPRDASGQWTASGGNAPVPDRPKVPRTREEFRHVAASLRRAVMRSTRGKVKDQCINAAYALKAVFPEAVIWSGMYGDDYHTVAKLGGKFIDVTADQFRGPKIVIRGELPGRAEGGRYWGFERNDDLPSGAEGTPIAREFRKLLAESPRLPPVQLSAVARKNRAKWDALAHPRGPNGRFIPKGSAEAHTAALAKVKALKGKPATRENVDELAGHLAILKRDHLRAIARAHGLKPPGKLREHLVQILMERLPGPKPEVVEKEGGEKHVRIESGGKSADYAVKPMKPGKGEQTALRLENQTSGEVYDVVKKDDGTVTCTCPGFKHRGRCKHVGAIKDLAEKGALPEPEKKAAEQHVAEQEAKDAYKAPGEFADIPRAGANAVLMKGATPEEQSRREKLVERLDAYERSFMETYQKKPDTRESVAHHNALMDSGLTENGLKDARAFAGKKASWKPGVFFPTAEHEDKVPGGKADDIPLEDFPPDKVAQGAAVEREHTSDPETAKEIARDHLAEDAGYYDKLKAVEREKPGEVPLEESPPAVQPGFEHLDDPGVMQAKAAVDQATSNVLRARQTPGTDDDDAADAAADMAEDAYGRAVDAAKVRAAPIPLEGPLEPEAATVPLEGQPPELGFTGTDRLGRKWVDGKLVAAEDEPVPLEPGAEAAPEPADVPLEAPPPEPAAPLKATERTENEAESRAIEESRDAEQPLVGDADRGRAGGPASVPPPAERIVTARAQHTKPADPGLVPESLRKHLDEHQIQGVAKAVSALDEHGGFLLADGTGIGKTRQQLAVAKTYADKGDKVLIVTKAEVIKPDWKKGKVTGSFANDSATMGVDLKLTKGDEALQAGQVHVTTYDRLAAIKGKIGKDVTIIFDESHALKNWDSARSKHGYEMSKAAGKVMYATATPADKPLHIAHLFRAKIFGNRPWDETYRELGMRQVDVWTGTQTIKKWEIDPKVGGAEVFRRMAGLFDRMTADGLMLKREISMKGVDIGFDRITMPPEAHAAMDAIDRALSGKASASSIAAARSKIADVDSQIRGLAADMRGMREGDAGYSIKDLPQATEQMRKLNAQKEHLHAELNALTMSSSGKLNEGLRQALTLMHQRRQQEPYKIPHVVDHVRRELAEGRQVVVFASRVNESEVTGAEGETVASSEGTAKLLREALEKAGVQDVVELHGGVTARKRLQAMNDFQAGKGKVIIATVESGGTGINLDDTAGDRPRSLIMMTAPFSAVENVQAAGRVWRLKTKSMPRIRYVFGDTDVDHWNAGLIAGKMKTLGAAVAGEVGALDVPDLDVSAEAEGERMAAARGAKGPAEPYAWRPLVRSREEREQAAQQAAAKKPSMPGIRRVQTQRGARHVYDFSPNEALWNFRKAKNPDWVSVKKDPNTGRWSAAIWGDTPEDVEAKAERLRAAGVRLSMDAPSRSVVALLEWELRLAC